MACLFIFIATAYPSRLFETVGAGMIAGIHRIGVTESMLKGKQGYGRCYMRRFEENQVSEKKS